MTAFRIWAEVSKDLAFSRWWPALCKTYKWSEHQAVERWEGSELVWPRVLDSLRSFTLFSQQKVILVQDADKALKKEKQIGKLLEELAKGPHHLILQAESKAPKAWSFDHWKGPSLPDSSVDERAVFRWIDAIQAQNLKLALQELERSLQSGQHPLVFLQLLGRHYRLGRLVHHAREKGLSESEILESLKIPSFVYQKWARARRISLRQWQAIFDRLHLGDLQLKSGFDQNWVLRKLSFDLVEISNKAQVSPIRFSMDRSGSLFALSFAQT